MSAFYPGTVIANVGASATESLGADEFVGSYSHALTANAMCKAKRSGTACAGRAALKCVPRTLRSTSHSASLTRYGEVMRCRSGALANSEFGAIPGLQRTADALRCVRDTGAG